MSAELNRTAAQMLDRQRFMVKYRGQALRSMQERGYAEDTRDRRYEIEVESLAQHLRYEDFRRTIEPLEYQRNKTLSDWYALQTSPNAEQPEWLKRAVAAWNERIESIGRTHFGYEQMALAPHLLHPLAE